MSTKARIGYKKEDGRYVHVYSHWDGEFETAGTILLKNYNTFEKAKNLVDRGDISRLAESDEKPVGHSFDKPVKGYCVFQMRDRYLDSDPLFANHFIPVVSADIKDVCDECGYIFMDGKWFGNNGFLDFFQLLEKCYNHETEKVETKVIKELL